MNPLSHLPANFQLKDYPALTVGLPLFTLLLLIIDTIFSGKLKHVFGLDPFAPFRLDLNKISFYVVIHNGFFHWLINTVALFAPMYHFERAHGTVYTGITLNLLAVTAALQYCIVGMVLYRHTHVIGLSGIIFLFLTYFSVKEHEFKPVAFSLGPNYNLPTKYSPFVSLILCAILIPGSSFFGHLAGISSGYLLAYGKLAVLYPPVKAILFIESKIPLKRLLAPLVEFISEEDGIELRNVSYLPFLSQDSEAHAATTATDVPTQAHSYTGGTHVLGN